MGGVGVESTRSEGINGECRDNPPLSKAGTGQP